MSREIKFRVWDGKNNIYSKDFDNINFRLDGDIFRVWTQKEKYILLDYSISLMQSTGLKDKNGKEIYEGDIVLRIFNDENGPNEVKETVEYHDGAFYPVCEEPGIGFEVIGNIYENPELINT